MARFRASKAAPATTSSAEAANGAAERLPFTPPRKAVARPDPVEMVVDSIVREMIPVAGADDRFDRLLERVQIRTRDEALGAEAVRAAAALRCRMPEGTWGTEVVVTQTIARFLAAEAAVTGRFDPRAALRRANVDRYLEEQRGYGSRSLHTRLWMLYAAGRIFHPGEYPRERAVAPRTKHVPPASTVEVEQLLALVPTLSAVVGQRLQTVVDLCWGVGARRADFRYLQGTAISTRRWQGLTVALVELRNNAGGTRTVPAFDPDLVERLGGPTTRAMGWCWHHTRRPPNATKSTGSPRPFANGGIRASTLLRSGTGGCWIWPNAYPQRWCCSWRMLSISGSFPIIDDSRRIGSNTP